MKSLENLIKEKDGKLYLELKIVPKSSNNKIVGYFDNKLKVNIKEPPEKGKANKELCKFISKILGIKKNDIQIIKGEKSREKVISISKITKKELIEKLSLFIKRE